MAKSVKEKIWEKHVLVKKQGLSKLCKIEMDFKFTAMCFKEEIHDNTKREATIYLFMCIKV